MVFAHVAATTMAVFVDPVKANLSTCASHRARPVSPRPVTQRKIFGNGATSANVRASHTPTPGVYSLGLNTTVFPAARAYAIDPIGVKIG